MKGLVLIFCLFALPSFGQTLEMEFDAMNLAYNKDNQSQTTKDKIAEWRNFVKNNTYPKLPYDTAAKSLVYQYIVDCKGMPIANIKNRVKEWVALNFGRYDAVLHYENDGKIIVKGYFDVFYEEKISLFFYKTTFPMIIPIRSNYIFTFKEGLLKIDISNTESGTNYIQKQESSTKFASFSHFFPISKWDSTTWRYYFEVLKQSDTEWKDTFMSIERYVLSEKEDFNFKK